jgi:hypothetical protein
VISLAVGGHQAGRGSPDVVMRRLAVTTALRSGWANYLMAAQ